MPTGQIEEKCTSSDPGFIRRDDNDRLIAYECDEETSGLKPPNRVSFEVSRKNEVDVAVNIRLISAAAATASPAAPPARKKSAAKKAAPKAKPAKKAVKKKATAKAAKKKSPKKGK